jgi:hypothetical protein
MRLILTHTKIIEGKRRAVNFMKWEELPDALAEANFVPLFLGVDFPQKLTVELSEKSDLLKNDYIFIPNAKIVGAVHIHSEGTTYFMRVYEHQLDVELRMEWVKGDQRSSHTRVHRIKHNGWVGSKLLDEILDGFRQYYLGEQDNVRQVD